MPESGVKGGAAFRGASFNVLFISAIRSERQGLDPDGVG
jgi:hypothetical protein